MTRPKPFRDSALDGKPPPAQHAFPEWYAGEVRCDRCHRAISEIDRRALECVTDAHVRAAQVAGDVVAALRRREGRS